MILQHVGYSYDHGEAEFVDRILFICAFVENHYMEIPDHIRVTLKPVQPAVLGDGETIQVDGKMETLTVLVCLFSHTSKIAAVM